jgi:hypothetical protein
MTISAHHFHHRTRRLLAAGAALFALAGLTGTAVLASGGSHSAPSPSRAAEATTAWIANNR